MDIGEPLRRREVTPQVRPIEEPTEPSPASEPEPAEPAETPEEETEE